MTGNKRVRKERNRRGFWNQNRHLPSVLLFLCLVLFPSPADAALITGSYELDWVQDVDKSDTETTDVRKFKQTLNLEYKGFLSPIVENEVTFKVEQEINSNAADTTRFLPTLDLGFKGTYWEATGGAKRTHENSDEPGKNPRITDTYFIEFFYTAPKRVPDLKAKYTVDKDFEEDTTDTLDREILLSSVYKPNDWLDVKADYDRLTSDDRLNADSDTENEKITGSVALRHFFSKKIKMDVKYDLEMEREATLLDAGGAENQVEDQTHRWTNAASFRPFRDTVIDGSYDYELKLTKATGEHTLTSDIKGTVEQRVSIFDVKGEFNRVITDTRHTEDDNKITEDTWTTEVNFKLSKQLDFTAKYEDKDTEEIHEDPTKNTTKNSVIWSGTWNGELAPFWKASISFDETDTLEDGIKTVVDTKYSYKSTFDFKAIYLTLEPTYDITQKEDLQVIPAEDSEIRDFRFKIAWQLFPTINTESKIDHTYGRKVDTGAGNIQRTDDTTWNLTWKDPAPGWTVSFDITRHATDTSEDDLEPDITSSFGIKMDYQLDRLSLNTNYKYDKKSASDDSERFDLKVGWAAPKWDMSLTYTFDKTFSVLLEEGYTINLTFTYNL